MGIGVGTLLLAVGAVLAFAVGGVNTGGVVNIHVVGYILMAVGALGILISMAFWSSWGGPGYFTNGNRRRTTVIDD